jgi:RND family efflux transporter MFP subunit
MMRAIVRRWRRAPGLAIPAVVAICSGCSPPPETRPEPVRPVKTLVVVAGDGAHRRSFPGKVDSSRRVELAFQVPGVLINFPVKEGQRVSKGELIGQLRPDEYEARLKALQGQLDQARAALSALRAGERPEERRRREAAVRAAEARLANARAEYERLSQLVRTGAVARTEFDLAESAYRVAQEELKSAVQALEKSTIGREEDIDAQEAVVRSLEGRVVEANLQLQDTTLRAPFDGVIAQRFVEQNQNIRAKEPVVRFQDAEEIEVIVDVPEAVMAGEIRQADIIEILAEFAGAPGVQFPMRIKEVSQQADPTTQTFAVRAAMPAPTTVRLLPGMSAVVTVAYRRASILGNRILVPVTSITNDGGPQPAAWVLGSDQVVRRRSVKLGAPTGERIEVLDGLQPGDRIITAGVRFLRDGMKVRDLGDALGVARP